MSKTKNNVNVLGYVGKPLVSREHDGVTYVSFSVATNEEWTSKEGELVERTDWHQVKMSGRVAKLALHFLDKGSLVDITGKLRTDEYLDKDGKKRWSTYINASDFIHFAKDQINMCGDRNEDSASDETEQKLVVLDEDLIPF